MCKNFLCFIVAISFCLFCKSQSSIPSFIPESGLIGWWSFTGNANDSSGNNNHGTANGATLTTDRFGNPNSAYSFNNSFITIPNSPLYEVNNYTISLWMSSTSILRQVGIIKLTYSNANDEQFGIVLNDLNPNGVQFATKFDNPSCLSGIGWIKNEQVQDILDGQFHHVVGTVNSDSLYLYIDGNLVKTSAAPSSSSSSCFNGEIQIGRNWASDINYFQGKIDDVAIWNRALSLQEINNIYTSTGPNVGINIKNPLRNLHVNNVMRLEPRNTAPSNPGKGDIYFDNNINKLRVFDGTVWQNCW